MIPINIPVLEFSVVKYCRKKSSQSKAAAISKNQNETITPVPLEVQTHLPLRTQDTARTEYVAPVRNVEIDQGSMSFKVTIGIFFT